MRLDRACEFARKSDIHCSGQGIDVGFFSEEEGLHRLGHTQTAQLNGHAVHSHGMRSFAARVFAVFEESLLQEGVGDGGQNVLPRRRIFEDAARLAMLTLGPPF